MTAQSDPLAAQASRLLATTMQDLRIGKRLGKTPFGIHRWRWRLRKPFGGARGGPLPQPSSIDWYHEERRWIEEEHLTQDFDAQATILRRRTIGYHWQLHKEGAVASGCDIRATVNADGDPEFYVTDRRRSWFGAGHPYIQPATPQGWVNTMDRANRLCERGTRVRLVEPTLDRFQ